MSAETRLIDTTTMTDAQVREIDFVEKFSDDIRKLQEVLGVTRKVAKQAGTVLKTYKATGTLQTGSNVAEGDIIPLSSYAVAPVSYSEITLSKWRKATSAEAIIEYGFDAAVNKTTERMLKDVQNTIRGAFFDFLAYAGTDPEGAATAPGTIVSANTFQGALAKSWGNLQALFENTDASLVFFVNPLDIADYLASASITTQTAFGMSYVENFLGLGTVIINSSVPQGTVYGTASENLVLYYIAANGADLANAFSMTSDATGYIGIHEDANYSRMTCEDTVINGCVFFAERIDGITICDFA